MHQDHDNARFWSELCGSGMARSIGADLNTDEGRRMFDEAYWDYYPYLKGYLVRTIAGAGSVLEIGLGAGTVARWISERVPHYTGLDVAPEVCSAVGSTVPGETVQASILEPPAIGPFDAGVAIGSLHHTGDLRLALRNLESLVRPGGKLLIMVYNEFELKRWIRRPQRTMRHAMDNVRGGDVWAEADSDMRFLNDSAKGEAAPHTAYTSARHLRRLGWRVDRQNAHALPYIGDRLRPVMLKTQGRVLGTDLYATKTAHRPAGAGPAAAR